MTAIDFTIEPRATRYPSIWRAMRANECHALEHGQSVTMMHRENGSFEMGTVVAIAAHGLMLKLSSAALFPFDPATGLDTSGEYALIVCGEYDNDDLTVALRASLEVGKLHRRATDLEIESQTAKRNADALLADVENMRDTLRGLILKRAS